MLYTCWVHMFVKMYKCTCVCEKEDVCARVGVHLQVALSNKKKLNKIVCTTHDNKHAIKIN